jgi:hypothetical protein
MMGFASIPTFWDDGKDGNVTAMGLGRYYSRIEDWVCEIDKVMA